MDVYLEKKDLSKLETRFPKIGKGKEGTLFRINKNTVYKIYHDYNDWLNITPPTIYDKDGVNIAKIKNSKQMTKKKNTLSYIDSEGVKLSKKEALTKAIELQEKIKLTSLPKGIISVNERVKGCVLKYHRGVNIFQCRYLSMKMRLLIFEKILLRVKELLKNNIYHVDLCQKPTEESNNTNILLKWNLVPEIIDLEGKSAIYTERESQALRKKVELGLNVLFFELLSLNDIEEELLDINEEMGKYLLQQNGFSKEIIQAFYKETLEIKTLEKHLYKMKIR